MMKLKNLLVVENIQVKSNGVFVPIKIGDTILVGKFKNKKEVVKTVEVDDRGILKINGRTALNFRLTDTE